MGSRTRQGKAAHVALPQPPRYTGYGLMVLAIALLGIAVLLLNVSEGKQAIDKQNLITAKVVQKYNEDVGVLDERIAELEAQLAACQDRPSP